MIKLEKILCPLDFSENSQEALQYAIHLMSKDDDATLYLVHVVDSRVFDYSGPIYEQEVPLMKVELDQVRQRTIREKIISRGSRRNSKQSRDNYFVWSTIS